MKIYFYPHKYLRDRQLDTIRRWPASDVVNPEIVRLRSGVQVSESYAKASKLGLSWMQKFPLINVKLRPDVAPKDSVIYVWGAITATGKFIVDLDNPWSLTGYNLRAMSVYRFLLKHVLLSSRCLEIRCMSEACRLSLKALFGNAVYEKATVHYPCLPQAVTSIDAGHLSRFCRFLFVGTQFEIKGGAALLKAFHQVYTAAPEATLDIITHLPDHYKQLAADCPNIRVHPAQFTREEIHQQFMCNADVLVLPTYVESYGMVALEALAHGLALITTDVYALREMVEDDRNGCLLKPPLSIWNNHLPSRFYFDIQNIKKHIKDIDSSAFEKSLADAMICMALDTDWRNSARKESITLMESRFSC